MKDEKQNITDAPENIDIFQAYIDAWFDVSGDMDDFIYFGEDITYISEK